ncbi:TPA: phage holin family protein, partial [Salmonella enterica]|nr:phage holin family protein [Salmonella enterica]
MDQLIDLAYFFAHHPLASFCGFSAFFISCWTGYVEKHTLLDVFMSGIVSVFSALSILDFLFKGEHYHLWLPLVGVIVGFVGPHNIRKMVLLIWGKYVSYI